MQTHGKTLKTLVQDVIQAARMGGPGPRELTDMAYGLARSGMGGQLGELFVELTRSTEQRLGEFNPQELANTAWAFARAVTSDDLLLRALATVA